MPSNQKMDPSTRSAGGFGTALVAIASSTAFFTLVCFALAMVLLMSQPLEPPPEQAPQADATDRIESGLTQSAMNADSEPTL